MSGHDKFFNAWLRGAQLAGFNWFGEGDEEPPSRCVDKWDLRAVQELLGHASPAITQRYVAVSEMNLRAAMNAAAD